MRMRKDSPLLPASELRQHRDSIVEICNLLTLHKVPRSIEEAPLSLMSPFVIGTGDFLPSAAQSAWIDSCRRTCVFSSAISSIIIFVWFNNSVANDQNCWRLQRQESADLRRRDKFPIVVVMFAFAISRSVLLGSTPQ